MHPNQPCCCTQTLIMHGTKDEVIDVAHAEHLLSKWPAASKHEPYIVPGAGHDDVFETDPEEFYRRLLDFIHAATNNQSFTTPPKAMTSPPIHPAKASDKLFLSAQEGGGTCRKIPSANC